MDTVESLKARIRELETMLGQRDRRYDVAFRVPKSQARLLGLLVSVPLVTNEMIEERLKIATNGRVAVHRLRQALARFGVVVNTHAGSGYSLTPEMKIKVTGIVDRLGVALEDLPEPVEA